MEAGGETPIDAKVRLAREAEAYRVDLHRKRDKVARLSPMMLLVLIALAFGVAALLLVYGGFL